jgi:hypothetical protein
MAYVSQERKAELAPGIKAVLKKHNVKGSLAVRHHSTLVINLSEGAIDFKACYQHNPEHFFGDHLQVNTYHINGSWVEPALSFLSELKAAASIGNHDRSDLQSDYFDVGWYVDINIGKWNKPYQVKEVHP